MLEPRQAIKKEELHRPSINEAFKGKIIEIGCIDNTMVYTLINSAQANIEYIKENFKVIDLQATGKKNRLIEFVRISERLKNEIKQTIKEDLVSDVITHLEKINLLVARSLYYVEEQPYIIGDIDLSGNVLVVAPRIVE